MTSSGIELGWKAVQQSSAVADQRVLDEKGVPYEEVDASDPRARLDMIQRAHGRRTAPQIFIGDAHIGGYDDIALLDRRGQFDALLV